MPDICLCRNEKCPIKVQCYRNRAIPDAMQVYANFKYELGGCDHFWPIQAGMAVIPKEETQKD